MTARPLAVVRPIASAPTDRGDLLVALRLVRQCADHVALAQAVLRAVVPWPAAFAAARAILERHVERPATGPAARLASVCWEVAGRTDELPPFEPEEVADPVYGSGGGRPW